MFPDTGKVLLD